MERYPFPPRTCIICIAQAVEPFRLTDRLSNSERAMLMGDACAKVYGWSPKKG
jgi:L-fuconolactonase